MLRKSPCQSDGGPGGHRYEGGGSVGGGILRVRCSICGEVGIQASGEAPVTAISARLQGEGEVREGTHWVGLLAGLRGS